MTNLIKNYIFERDYINNPLKNWKDDIPKNDLLYLYIDLNLTRESIADLLNVSVNKVKRNLKKYNIHKDTKKIHENAKKTMIEKYGSEHALDIDKFKDKSKQTKLERYNDPVYNNRQKAKETIIDKYGDHPMKIKEFVDKFKKTNQERYGVDFPMKNDYIKNKLKKSIQDKYGVDNLMHSEEFLKKVHDTKLKNGTSSSSSVEDDLYTLLKTKFPNTKHHYSSEKYPFDCDFYIPELDLYIEYQGFWSHGPNNYHEPFNPKNKNHLQVVQDWENKHRLDYDKAIDTWTVRDPLKRKIAHENNLNWLEFFTVLEFKNWFDKL